KSAQDIDDLIQAFEVMYTKVYPEGARFPDAGYSVTAVHLEAVAPKPQPVLGKRELKGEKPSDSAYVGSRDVFHRDAWMQFRVFEMQELDAGNEIEGPAINRDPMTTVVVPPNRRMELDEYRILHYR
ncbi:hydantoinase/oxoprolinase family protein, partial [Myxococcota bacterium]|nr:hydantoinase/oxoprolinase family protein [Myxococcota bacterium]